MSGPGSHHPPRGMQPTDYEDMRARTRALADRASQAGLFHIAYALEVVVVLLDEAQLAALHADKA